MGNYKTVNRLKLNYFSVSVILVLACVSTRTSNTATSEHGSPSTSETTTGVNSTHPGLLFNTSVNMSCFSVHYLSIYIYTNGL